MDRLLAIYQLPGAAALLGPRSSGNVDHFGPRVVLGVVVMVVVMAVVGRMRRKRRKMTMVMVMVGVVVMRGLAVQRMRRGWPST